MHLTYAPNAHAFALLCGHDFKMGVIPIVVRLMSQQQFFV